MIQSQKQINNIDTTTDAILVDTGTTLPAQITTLSNDVKDQVGIVVTKSNVCNGNGVVSDNIFEITGAVKILGIYAEITAVGNSFVFSNHYYDLYDGAASVEITDNSGSNMSGYGVGAIMYKNTDATTAIYVLNNVSCSVVDAVNDLSLKQFIAIKKTGADTFIRHNFTTNVDTDVTMLHTVVYVPLTSDGLIEAVA